MGLGKVDGPNSWWAYHIVLGFVPKDTYDDEEMFQLFLLWPHQNGSLNVVILELVFAFDQPSNQTNVKWVDPIPRVPAAKVTLKKKKMVLYNMIRMGAETRKKKEEEEKDKGHKKG
ncbi:unnamed protein product [Sphenostylis stenocarpa]|uniref:Uncharacterized protein n=1 Tax=Sphenostylis stenocarpa TaxID=92480 RepID=A0AA86TP49_9FABA|nr:unnamed protein product [Sphenostylis stenocarpa]